MTPGHLPGYPSRPPVIDVNHWMWTWQCLCKSTRTSTYFGGSRHTTSQLQAHGLAIQMGAAVSACDYERLLGVTISVDLRLDRHVSVVSAASSYTGCVKATFHYSTQVQTWLSTRFSTSSCGFATCFRLFVENLVANLLHQSRRAVVTSLSKFAAGFRLAFDMLATCFRHAHASRKPALQLAKIIECGL